MKRLCLVTIIFCLIISCFIVPSFAVNPDSFLVLYDPRDSALGITYEEGLTYYNIDTRYGNVFKVNTDYEVYFFGLNNGYFYTIVTPDTYNSLVSADSIVAITSKGSGSGFPSTKYTKSNFSYDSDYDLYYKRTNYSVTLNNSSHVYCKMFDSYDNGMIALKDFIDNPPSQYTKNPNVDEFIANTLISMGVTFNTPADALSYASDAWNWCIDEDNMESATPSDEWNIDSFVSYCNAQSNNYLNWYNGYKVSKDVTNALGEYIRQNIRSLSGLPSGVSSLTGAYLPIYHYGSGFQSGVSSPTAQTFYAAQTITYFNGEYVNETNDISTSQFLYTPPDVRRFLGYPGSSPTITPSSPTGTGTIIDDPNNPDQKNITINFPDLDWLADAIKSILDFLRDAFTTLANLLTQLLDAILGLFSDAFESLSEFGEGIIEWLYAIVAGFSTIGGNYIPSSLWAVILPFILINIGVGLIMFVMRSH